MPLFGYVTFAHDNHVARVYTASISARVCFHSRSLIRHRREDVFQEVFDCF